MSDNEFLACILIGLLFIVLVTAGASQQNDERLPLRSIDLIGLGDDYCIYYNDGPASVWDQSWIRARLETYKVQAVRLGFMFTDASHGATDGSIYNEAKMKLVLGYLDASDVKGILLLQNNNVSCKLYAGSVAWYNNWIAVANAFKDDDRVAAFSIFGEPEHYSGYDTWDPSITSTRQLQARFLELAKAIHQIDPDRVVIMPFPMAYGNPNVQTYIDDIIAVGALQEPNLIFDVIHPYFTEDSGDMGMTPTQKAQWYLNNWIQPCINAFGADRCYCGETFGFSSKTEAYQIEFLTAMLNVFVEEDIGFTVWSYFSSPNQSWQNEAIQSSNY